jgi:hypothetical protein
VLGDGNIFVNRHYGQVTKVWVKNVDALIMRVNFRPDVGGNQTSGAIAPGGEYVFDYPAKFAEEPYLHSFELDIWTWPAGAGLWNVFSNVCG